MQCRESLPLQVSLLGDGYRLTILQIDKGFQMSHDHDLLGNDYRLMIVQMDQGFLMSHDHDLLGDGYRLVIAVQRYIYGYHLMSTASL